MTLTSILAALYEELGYATSPAAAITTRLTRRVNDVHRKILSTPGLQQLRDDVMPFASVADQARYGLPPNIARIRGIHQRDNMRTLGYQSLADLRASDPGLTSGGTPDYWTPIGYQAVQIQPTAATGLWIVSDSAADTVPTVRVETITTGGYRHASGATTLTGLTRAQIGSLTSHIEVVKFYLSAACAGNISLYDAASSGNELARIEIGKTYSRYWGIQLWPTPSAVETFYVDYTRVIADMSVATDEPLLPEDFHQMLVSGSLMQELTKKDQLPQRLAWKTDYDERMKALKDWVLYPPDFDATPQGATREGSNLGGWFPSGRW